MATKELKRAKAHKLLKNHDPELNPLDYNESLMRATNYLNTNYDTKDRMKWIKARFPKVKFVDAADIEFKTLSTLVRLTDNGNELSDKHEALMQSELVRLTAPATKIKVEILEKVTKSTPTIQEKMNEKVAGFLAEFSGMVDDYVTTKSIGNVEKLVAQMGIRGPMVKKVKDRIQGTIDELSAALLGEDKDLVEGYSNFKKVELKRLLGMYQSLIVALGQAKVITVRKTRTVKIKPPTLVAARVKYQVENIDLKIKSIVPASVIGASELWVFNTKYRTLQYYEAIVGQTLTFKGTTLLNFNVEKSHGKTIRKPEALQSLVGKRMYAKFMKETRSTEKKLTGRINEECILLVAFK